MKNKIIFYGEKADKKNQPTFWSLNFCNSQNTKRYCHSLIGSYLSNTHISCFATEIRFQPRKFLWTHNLASRHKVNNTFYKICRRTGQLFIKVPGLVTTFNVERLAFLHHTYWTSSSFHENVDYGCFTASIKHNLSKLDVTRVPESPHCFPEL